MWLCIIVNYYDPLEGWIELIDTFVLNIHQNYNTMQSQGSQCVCILLWWYISGIQEYPRLWLVLDCQCWKWKWVEELVSLFFDPGRLHKGEVLRIVFLIFTPQAPWLVFLVESFVAVGLQEFRSVGLVSFHSVHCFLWCTEVRSDVVLFAYKLLISCGFMGSRKDSSRGPGCRTASQGPSALPWGSAVPKPGADVGTPASARILPLTAAAQPLPALPLTDGMALRGGCLVLAVLLRISSTLYHARNMMSCWQ